jgi:hypothetical protein
MCRAAKDVLDIVFSLVNACGHSVEIMIEFRFFSLVKSILAGTVQI